MGVKGSAWHMIKWKFIKNRMIINSEVVVIKKYLAISYKEK